MHNREKKGRKGNKGNASTVIGNMMNANNAQRNENESQRPIGLKVDFHLNRQQLDQLQEAWDEYQKSGRFPILGPGLSLVYPQPDVHERLDRLERKVGELMIGMQMITASIERKLDTLLAALAEEDEEPVAVTLDGERVGGERDQGQSL